MVWVGSAGVPLRPGHSAIRALTFRLDVEDDVELRLTLSEANRLQTSGLSTIAGIVGCASVRLLNNSIYLRSGGSGGE